MNSSPTKPPVSKSLKGPKLPLAEKDVQFFLYLWSAIDRTFLVVRRLNLLVWGNLQLPDLTPVTSGAFQNSDKQTTLLIHPLIGQRETQQPLPVTKCHPCLPGCLFCRPQPPLILSERAKTGGGGFNVALEKVFKVNTTCKN